MYEVGELVFFISVLSLCTFAISSMWLYSPGLSVIRTWWSDYKNTNWLSALGYCQLCCSFWIALGIMPFIMPFELDYTYVIFAILASGVSWMLGAITNAALWVRAVCEDIIVEKSKYEKM